MKLISVFLLLLLFFSKQQAELPKDTSRRTSILSPFGFSNPMDMHTWISRWIGWTAFFGSNNKSLDFAKMKFNYESTRFLWVRTYGYVRVCGW